MKDHLIEENIRLLNELDDAERMIERLRKELTKALETISEMHKNAGVVGAVGRESLAHADS